jgi:hypothetical protein
MTASQLTLERPPTGSATLWPDTDDSHDSHDSHHALADLLIDITPPASAPAATEPVPSDTALDAPQLAGPDFLQRHRVAIVLSTGVLPFFLVPAAMLIDTPIARLVTDSQQAQFSNVLDWAIVTAVAVVALVLIGMRYVFRRRQRKTNPVRSYTTVRESS